MCPAGALSVLLLLSSAQLAFCQVSDTAEARPEDVAGQPQENALPPGLIQARDIPPEMQITKEMYTDAEEIEFRRKGLKPFEDALKSSNLTDEEKKAIDAGAKYMIDRFTMKKFREEEAPKKGDKPGAVLRNAPPKERLHDLRKTILNDIKLKAKTPASREYLLKAITDRCEQLLDNHFIVRLNVVLLLSQLSSEYPTKVGVEPPAYVGACPVLLKVVKDDKQHQAIKIPAVRGLIRICRTGLPPDPNDKRRAEIALALAAELKRNDTYWWYQMVLVECLATAGVTVDPAARNNPVVLDALRDTISDKKRHWEVRTKAAKAVGRLPPDNNVNIAPTAYAIANLGYEMAQAYNASPARVEWKYYSFNLFFAFKAERGEPLVLGKRKPGLMEALPNSKDVKDAYDQILLIANHMLNADDKQFSKEQLKGFSDWLDSRRPANVPPANNAPVGASPKSEPAPQTKPASTGSAE